MGNASRGECPPYADFGNGLGIAESYHCVTLRPVSDTSMVDWSPEPSYNWDHGAAVHDRSTSKRTQAAAPVHPLVSRQLRLGTPCLFVRGDEKKREPNPMLLFKRLRQLLQFHSGGISVFCVLKGFMLVDRCLRDCACIVFIFSLDLLVIANDENFP